MTPAERTLRRFDEFEPTTSLMLHAGIKGTILTAYLVARYLLKKKALRDYGLHKEAEAYQAARRNIKQTVKGLINRNQALMELQLQTTQDLARKITDMKLAELKRSGLYDLYKRYEDPEGRVHPDVMRAELAAAKAARKAAARVTW